MTEYVIWGKCPASNHEEIVLISNAGSLERANNAMKALANKHGCYDMRVQTFDTTKPLDFAKEALQPKRN